MGWVVSKSLKKGTIEKVHRPDVPEACVLSSIASIEDANNASAQQSSHVNFEVSPKENVLQDGCDILIIDHDAEYRNSANFLNSAMIKEESISSLQLEISEPIQISSEITEYRTDNMAQKSSNDVKVCPTTKNKIPNGCKGQQKLERKHISCPRTSRVKQLDPSKKDTIKTLSTKKRSVKPDMNMLGEGQVPVENYVPSTKVNKSDEPMKPAHKHQCRKVSKKSNPKSENQKNLQMSSSSNKVVNKLTFPKINMKTNETKKNKIANSKAKILKNGNVDLKMAQDDLMSMLRERNFSPNKVNDLEKNLQMDGCDLERNDDNPEIIMTTFPRNFDHKNRPSSAYLVPTNGKAGFDKIIKDFNRKLDKIISDNHMISCLCNNCYQNEPNLENNKTTAGKITFFFLKKYGNFGKFILARLNEFLDNVYDVETDEKDVPNKCSDDFPLPCNINDIEYEGDLKSYRAMEKEGIFVKPKISRTKLPKLIYKPVKNKVQEKNPDPDTSREEKNKNRNESRNSKKKTRFKDTVEDEIKTDWFVEKSSNVDISLPPLKPASSIVNFCKSSNSTMNSNIVFQTMNLSPVRSPLPNVGYNDIVNFVYEENTLFNDRVLQSCIYESNRTENDFLNSSFRSMDPNDENITMVADKMINDLWKNTFVLGCQDNFMYRN